MALRTRFKPYKPYVTPRPPSGTYDPNLNAAERASGRGLGDVRQDTALGGARAAQDFQFGQDSYSRGFARQQQDFDTSLQMMRRQYDILAGRQESQAAGQGVISGGALLQSAAKRAANEGLQRTQLQTGLDRAREDRDIGIGRLGVEFQRGETDRTTGLTRAEREGTAFTLDTAAQRNFQAAQAGYAPPLPGEPGGARRNEFTNRNGLQRRRIVRGGVEYIVAPNGAVVHHRRLGGRGRG